jgi:ABC-2 type transport system ATP-binding protein
MLHVSGLRKSFGPVKAVTDVSFTLEAGRATALLGENGAGKTTTLRLILGFLRADAGTVELGAGRVGYVPDHPVYLPWLSGHAVLELTRLALAACDRGWDSRIRNVSERILFDPALLGRRPGTYSAGNLKKFACLQSLVIEPRLLVVDEPFSALDPPSIKRMREVFIETRDRGAAVLLSSHMLDEMVKISDDFIVLRRGEVVARDGLPGFLSRFRPGGAGEVEAGFLGLMSG